MNKLTFLKSKVFWTGVVAFIINVAYPAYKQDIPSAYVAIVSAALVLLATAFHVNDVNTASAHAVPQAPDTTPTQSQN